MVKPIAIIVNVISKDNTMSTYKIIRLYQNHTKRVIRRGLTLQEAQEHCSNPETSSRTCTKSKNIARTKRMGPWFDGYDYNKE